MLTGVAHILKQFLLILTRNDHKYINQLYKILKYDSHFQSIVLRLYLIDWTSCIVHVLNIFKQQYKTDHILQNKTYAKTQILNFWTNKKKYFKAKDLPNQK